MRNLTNTIDKINMKAESAKRKVEAKRVKQIGRAMLSHQDEVDKLKRMILRMDIQMSVAKLDPCADEAFQSAIAERQHRREQAAKRAEKKRAEAMRAAVEARRTAAAAAATAADTPDEINHFLRIFRA